MNDHPDTDLTDPHGEAEALRRENARLRVERDYDRSQSAHKSTVIDRLNARAEAAEAALAASRAPDPVVNAGGCQQLAWAIATIKAAMPDGLGWDAEYFRALYEDESDMDRAFAIIANAVDRGELVPRRALPAAPVAEVQPDWKAMAERLGDAGGKLDKAASEVIARGAQTGPQWSRLTAASLHFRAALSDLTEMKGE